MTYRLPRNLLPLPLTFCILNARLICNLLRKTGTVKPNGGLTEPVRVDAHIIFFFRFSVKMNMFFVFNIYFLIRTIKRGCPLMTTDRKQVIFTVKSLNLWPIRAVKAKQEKAH